MDNISPEPPFLSAIGLMLTYKCNIACPHCLVKAGPHRTEEVDLEQIISWLPQARAFRSGHIKNLALTGGEPFLNLDKLDRISEYANSLGFFVSVVTNAFWATSHEAALKILSSLPGVRLVSFSTDVYHQKMIPLENILNGIKGARECGLAYDIVICTDNEKNEKFKQIVDKLKENGEEENIRIVITFPAGRAQKKTQQYNFSSEPDHSACTMAGFPVVFPNGNVIGCIGPLITLPPSHPLFLGNLNRESLAEILERAEQNLILHTIRVWGPYKLVSLLKQNGLDKFLPQEYIVQSACDVCYKLLSQEQVVKALEEILQDTEIIQRIAYGRLYYLKEPEMLNLAGVVLT